MSLLRLMLIFITPIAVVWAFTETLIREGRAAFWYARNEARIAFDQARDAWRNNSMENDHE